MEDGRDTPPHTPPPRRLRRLGTGISLLITFRRGRCHPAIIKQTLWWMNVSY